MNYRKGILINLILISLLTVMMIIVSIPEKSDVSDESSPEIELVGLSVSEIAAVAVINDAARYGLIHRDGQISLEPSIDGASYSIEVMQSFLYSLSKLKAVSSIEYNGDDAVYGFKDPRAAITLILSSGEKVKLILGSSNPIDGSVYLQFDKETDIVYLVSAEDAELFFTTPSYFSSDFLLPRVELNELDTLSSIRIDYMDRDVPSFRIENKGGFLFTLTKPIISTVDYGTVLKELIFPVLSLSSIHRESLFPGLLQSSEKILTMEISLSQSDRYSLSLFRHEGKIFAGTDKGLIFAELAEENLPFLSLHYQDFLNGSAYHCNVSEIESLVIEDAEGGMDYNISLTGEAVEINALINNTPIGYPQTMEFLEVLLKTDIAGISPDTGSEDSDTSPIFIISVYKKTGGMDRIEFIPVENNELTLRINGSVYFTTYYKTVLDIRKTMSELFLKEGV